ncbi:MAG: helix-turn-helix transcriptional regulator [Steroidobacteraceae bacterium]
MRISSELTDAAIAQTLGERIARHRIEASLTQAELAERAGIGKRTLERVEAGLGAELVTLIRILRSLNATEGFEKLLPELPASPIEQLKLRGKQRQRVSHARRGAPLGRGHTVRKSTSASPWRWGEPAQQGEPATRSAGGAKRKP